MKFSVGIHETEVGNLLLALINITGAEPWKRRFSWIQRELNENPSMRDWLLERCLIEWTMNDVLAKLPLVPNQPFNVETAAQYELVGFAAGVVRTYERLSDIGKRRLLGVLLDGLKEDKGLLSVQHEIATVVHLMSRGFDVEFNDMEHGGGFDFVARKDDIEIEVECKMFSADLGRKIHRRRSATFFNTIKDLVEQMYNSATVGLIINVTIPDRLTPSPEQHHGIEKAIRMSMLQGHAFTQTEHCAVSVVEFPIQESPFNASPEKISQEEVEKFVRKHTGQINSNLMILFSPKQRTVIVSIVSEKNDDVLGGMYRQLREAAKGQFSRTRPAILTVQLHDLTPSQLVDLAKSDSTVRANANGLQIMTSDFLQSPSRGHIHTVAYRAHGTFDNMIENGGKRMNEAGYIIKNGYHPKHDDPRYAIFEK